MNEVNCVTFYVCLFYDSELRLIMYFFEDYLFFGIFTRREVSLNYPFIIVEYCQ